MPTTPSPLRYPGGKVKLYPYIKDILNINNLHRTYIEPFAGGAGLAIKLLLNNDVNNIIINDSDRAIYLFWKCVLNHTDALCEFIDSIPITYEEWTKQKLIYLNSQNYSELDVGKAVFFLNRTNVSGILNGGVIGGKGQSGAYSMDARFNRVNLIKKITHIASFSDQISIYNMDILDFLSSKIAMDNNTFVYFDPPYVEKGGKLYKNSFKEKDHRNLKDAISRCPESWIVTYDVCDLIKNLYKQYRGSLLDITYTAKIAKKSKEYVFFSQNLILPEYFDSLKF